MVVPYDSQVQVQVLIVSGRETCARSIVGDHTAVVTPNRGQLSRRFYVDLIQREASLSVHSSVFTLFLELILVHEVVRKRRKKRAKLNALFPQVEVEIKIRGGRVKCTLD